MWKQLLLGFGSGIHGNIANFGFKSTQTPQEIIIEPEQIFSNATETVFVQTPKGEIYSWGGGANFVLGNGPYQVDSSSPQHVLLPPVQDLSLSSTHAIAITLNGDLYTWGNQALGRGIHEKSISDKDKGTPMKISLPRSQSELYSQNSVFTQADLIQTNQPISCAAGLNHSLVVTSGGDVYGFGCDIDGAIGFNNTSEKSKRYDLPTKIPFPYNEKIVSVVAGKRHSLFKTNSGTLYACGDNGQYQCGIIGQNKNIRQPTQVLFPTQPNGDEVKVEQMSAGANHSCIVSTTGDLYCWGSNTNGQLGLSLSPHVNKSVGQAQNPIKNVYFAEHNIKVKKVKCGGSHTAVIDTNDQLWLFGSGKDGQLSNRDGNGIIPLTTSNNDTPIPISFTHGATVDVELGNNTTYVVVKQQVQC